MTIINALKRMMKSKNMTQTDVAARLGKTQSSVAMYLKSGDGMKLESLLKMAETCGYAVVLEDKSGTGKRFVLSGDSDEEEEEEATQRESKPPEKEDIGNMLKAFAEWYEKTHPGS